MDGRKSIGRRVYLKVKPVPMRGVRRAAVDALIGNCEGFFIPMKQLASQLTLSGQVILSGQAN